MKLRPVGAELFHADRRKDVWRDRHEADSSRFSQFMNAPKNDTC